MYKFIRRLTLKQLTLEELPLLVIALGITELFYKFHSFLLEAVGFLLTWLALGSTPRWFRSMRTARPLERSLAFLRDS